MRTEKPHRAGAEMPQELLEPEAEVTGGYFASQRANYISPSFSAEVMATDQERGRHGVVVFQPDICGPEGKKRTLLPLFQEAQSKCAANWWQW